MIPDWLQIVSAIAAIISAVIAVYSAVSARKDLREIRILNQGITQTITNAVSKAVNQAVGTSSQSVNIAHAENVTVGSPTTS